MPNQLATPQSHVNREPTAMEPAERSVSDMAREKTDAVRARGSEYVDNASSAMGRALQSAADGLSDRAMRTTGGMARAGTYLERSHPEDFGHDLTDWVRNHPGVSIGVGLGIGFLLGRALTR